MTQYQTKVAWLMIKILLSKRPIHNIPECFNEFRARVAVIDVIGMLPYIEREQRLGRSGQRRARIAVDARSSEPSACLTSQAQPEPKVPSASFVNASLKLSYAPHLR